eukprot:GHVR01054410.1.p2 GENE.GHVR01054410.1~~GHVR01054410.1.p2  ORF type:complete len:128 (+),score=10.90 GHVR01054410.1:250-633(+)
MLRSWQVYCPWQPNLQGFPIRNQVSEGRLTGLSSTLGRVEGALTVTEVDKLAVLSLATLAMVAGPLTVRALSVSFLLCLTEVDLPRFSPECVLLRRALPNLSVLLSFPLLTSSVNRDSSRVSRLATR